MKTTTQMLLFFLVIMPMEIVTMSAVPTLIYKMGHPVLADLSLMSGTLIMGYLFWLVFHVKEESDNK